MGQKNRLRYCPPANAGERVFFARGFEDSLVWIRKICHMYQALTGVQALLAQQAKPALQNARTLMHIH